MYRYIQYMHEKISDWWWSERSFEVRELFIFAFVLICTGMVIAYKITGLC